MTLAAFLPEIIFTFDQKMFFAINSGQNRPQHCSALEPQFLEDSILYLISLKSLRHRCKYISLVLSLSMAVNLSLSKNRMTQLLGIEGP
jgi:hypothetical protein